jgi:hypothetical protein
MVLQVTEAHVLKKRMGEQLQTTVYRDADSVESSYGRVGKTAIPEGLL